MPALTIWISRFSDTAGTVAEVQFASERKSYSSPNGPMRFEAVFEAPADKPAIFRARPVPTLAESIHLGAAVYPASTEFAVDEPLVVNDANAGRRRANPVLTNRAEGRERQRRMIEGRPIEITFDAKQKVAGLNVIASLYTRN